MANSFNTNPAVFDTDFTSFRANQTLVSQSSNALAGIRPYKITIIAKTTTTAGTLSFTAPDGINLYPPVAISAAQTAGTVIYVDNLTQLINWRDFGISGLTATGAEVFIWYRS